MNDAPAHSEEAPPNVVAAVLGVHSWPLEFVHTPIYGERMVRFGTAVFKVLRKVGPFVH
jgi:hypothetical protein